MSKSSGGRTSHPRADKYRGIFLHSPIPLWVGDISKLRAMIKGWQSRGIRDLHTYLASHPGVLRKAIRSIRVIDVNDVTLQLYEAKNKKELLDITLYARAIPILMKLVISIAEGREELEIESTARSLKGRKLDLFIKTYIPAEGDKYPYMLVSVIDIYVRKRLERTLSEEKATLHTVIDNIPDQIFLKDRKGRFVLANWALAQWAGVANPGELIGKSDFDFFPYDIAQKYRKDDQALLKSGKARPNIEEQIGSGAGSLGWALTTKAPVCNQSGKVSGLVGIVRDVTKRRLLEQQNLLLATLVNSSDDAIVGTDLERRITVWNRGAERIYGYSAEEVIGTALSTLIPPGYEEETRKVRERVMQGEQVTSFETARLRKDGSRITVSMTLSPIRDPEGRIVGLGSTARDITAQKALETQVNRAQRLESLATLARGVAHQFNNINTAISGYLQMLLSEKGLSPEAASYVNAAHAGVERAANITDRLLVLTEPGGLSESLQFDVLARTVLSLHEKRIEEEKVRLVLDLAECPLVVGSEKSLKFVLASLIGNALDSLLDRPERMLAVRTGSRENAAYCEVEDSGCGIPAEDLPRIFSPFFSAKGEWAQTGSPQTRLKGVGLSLAICSRFISESGGRIDVESVPQQGSTFRVWFPASTATLPKKSPIT